MSDILSHMELNKRAKFELAQADPHFGAWDNLLVQKIKKMSLKNFLGHPFTIREMRLL
jgi:hypothetical protein